MSLKVLLHPKAARALKKLGAPTRRELKRKLAELENRPAHELVAEVLDLGLLRLGLS